MSIKALRLQAWMHRHIQKPLAEGINDGDTCSDRAVLERSCVLYLDSSRRI